MKSIVHVARESAGQRLIYSATVRCGALPPCSLWSS